LFALIVVAIGAAAALVVPATSANAAPPFVEFVNQGSHSCMDLRREDGGGRNARAQQWACFGTSNQRWATQYVMDSGGLHWFYVVSQQTKQCLEVRDSSFSNGAQVDQFPCAPDGNQLWAFVPNRGYDEVVNLGSRKCLDVAGHSAANGAWIQQWTCSGSLSQTWTFGGF
jgi:hypothetical protein